ALQCVNPGHLPAAEQRVNRVIPVIAEMAALAERQFPDVTRYESLLDVKFSQPAIRAQVIAVLRFLEGTGVKSRSTAAGRDVIRRAGQGLAPGVTDQPGQALGEAFLQTRLQ